MVTAAGCLVCIHWLKCQLYFGTVFVIISDFLFSFHLVFVREKGLLTNIFRHSPRQQN